MQKSLKKLKKSMIISSDDFKVGEVKDFFFDDNLWGIRYFVVNTGSWLNERLVLISPYAITKIEFGGFNIRVNLTKEQIENCPTPDDEEPVSRMYEEKYSRYYQLPYYWLAGDGLWPNNIYPTVYANMLNTEDKTLLREREALDEKIATNHLRSFNEVLGYHVHAEDEVFGHIQDFVFNEESYEITNLMIDTATFLPGTSVLIAPKWITEIDWQESEFHTDLTKDQIKHARHVDYDRPIDNELR